MKKQKKGVGMAPRELGGGWSADLDDDGLQLRTPDGLLAGWTENGEYEGVLNSPAVPCDVLLRFLNYWRAWASALPNGSPDGAAVERAKDDNGTS